MSIKNYASVMPAVLKGLSLLPSVNSLSRNFDKVETVRIMYKEKTFLVPVRGLIEFQMNRNIEDEVILIDWCIKSILHEVIKLYTKGNSLEEFYDAQMNGF